MGLLDVNDRGILETRRHHTVACEARHIVISSSNWCELLEGVTDNPTGRGEKLREVVPEQVRLGPHLEARFQKEACKAIWRRLKCTNHPILYFLHACTMQGVHRWPVHG